MTRLLAVLAALLLVLAASPGVASAEEEWDWVEPDLPPPGTPPDPAHVDNLAADTASKLRCPVCASASVADSSAEFATNMRNRIRELIAAGYTEQQILDYYEDGYGERILLQPKVSGLNWALWVAPGAGAMGGLAWLMVVVARWRREPDDVPLPSDVGLTDMDPYEARLLRELDE